MDCQEPQGPVKNFFADEDNVERVDNRMGDKTVMKGIFKSLINQQMKTAVEDVG